ncbi:MAG: Arc family DNA-binding protein [Corynebacterium sp.]|uniref:Arc family DNA-binding protein n=1 Tax=Corynebacterium sp. TaxID=1720 RepID=UPI0026E06279|nr:Arc family DNA-binding protein [Corynebacterium sp.]MDO5668599.1 Arc family DNA-binding protein [Corynebacterium sp.]
MADQDSPPPMSADQEYEFYSRPENQIPQGPGRRRSRLSSPIPVRFSPETLDEVKRRAAADDRSVSSWIRQAVQQKLDEPA